MNIARYDVKPDDVSHIKSPGIIVTVIRLSITEKYDEELQQQYWECEEAFYNHQAELTEEDYGPMVSTIIRERYSADDVEAITQAYLTDPIGYAETFNEFQQWRDTAKRVARAVIGIEQTLQEAIVDKLQELKEYDKSAEVNSCYINNNPVWFSAEERLKIKNGIESGAVLGREAYTIVFNGWNLVLPNNTALQFLAQLECYAVECYNVTASHELAISRLDSIEEVNVYDFTLGYPEKLNIEVPV